MSRYCGEDNADSVLRAASEWRDRALIHGTSVFSDRVLWSGANIEDLHRFYVEAEGDGEGTCFRDDVASSLVLKQHHKRHQEGNCPESLVVVWRTSPGIPLIGYPCSDRHRRYRARLQFLPLAGTRISDRVHAAIPLRNPWGERAPFAGWLGLLRLDTFTTERLMS